MRGCSPLPVVPRALRMRRRPPRNGRRVWLCRFGAFSLYAEERSATLGAWVLQSTNISRENCNRESERRLSFLVSAERSTSDVRPFRPAAPSPAL